MNRERRFTAQSKSLSETSTIPRVVSIIATPFEDFLLLSTVLKHVNNSLASNLFVVAVNANYSDFSQLCFSSLHTQHLSLSTIVNKPLHLNFFPTISQYSKIIQAYSSHQTPTTTLIQFSNLHTLNSATVGPHRYI